MANLSPSPKRILVVDDDDAFRLALKSALESSGYEVLAEASPKAAESIIGLEKIDAVISDIRFPDGNGIQLLHFIKRTNPLPVILMTGFAELKETKEAFDLGADEFLAKPFKREDLVEALKAVLADDGPAPAPEDSDDNYCKLGIDDFVSGKQMQSDIFIRLSEHKFVKIAHKGEDLSLDQIKAYKSKNVHYLYMRKDDFRRYIGFNLTLSKALKTSGKIAKVKKLNFMKHAGETILENLFFNTVDAETFEYAQNVVETTLSIVTDEKDIFDLLDVLNDHADYLYAHSLGVSMYGVMIAKTLGWNSPASRFKVSMGGMLHDIGKKEIDPLILAKARKDMSGDEIRAFESHTQRGLEILGQVASVPSDVLQMVMQHHENNLGLGYPAGLKASRIHPMAKVIAVANEFCNLAIKNPNSEGMTPEDAITRLTATSSVLLDGKALGALMRVFHIVPPEDLQ